MLSIDVHQHHMQFLQITLVKSAAAAGALLICVSRGVHSYFMKYILFYHWYSQNHRWENISLFGWYTLSNLLRNRLIILEPVRRYAKEVPCWFTIWEAKYVCRINLNRACSMLNKNIPYLSQPQKPDLSAMEMNLCNPTHWSREHLFSDISIVTVIFRQITRQWILDSAL